MPKIGRMTQISHAHIIERLGGITAVAKHLGIKPPSVAGWIEEGRNGIPDGRLIELGAEIEARTDYRRWDLRPMDWWRIWPELVEAPGAPAVPQEPAAAEQGA